jgi:hypothetical protein
MVQNLENFKEGYSLKSKKLFAILTLVAFMITLVPVAAFATTTNTALTVPYVTTGPNKVLGTIRMTETEATAGALDIGDQFTITLPSNVTYGAATTPVVGQVATRGTVHYAVRVPASVGVNDNRLVTATIINASNRSLTVQVTGVRAGALPAAVEILFNGMTVSSGSGPIEVEVLDLSNKITSGKIAVANVIGAGSKISALNVGSVSEGDGKGIGAIRVIEDAPGALTTGNTIDLTLPDYYRWTGVPVTGTVIAPFSGNGLYVVTYPGLNSSGRDVMRLTVGTANSATLPGAFDVVGAQVNVLPNAPLGEVNMSIGGTNSGITPSTLVAFKKVEFQTSITALDVPVRYAGNHDVKMGKIQIKEMAAGSIINGRTIRLDVPNNAVWITAPIIENVTGTDGSTLIPAAPTFANNDRTLIYNVAASSAGGSASTFNFKDGKISIRANSELGDVKVTVGGTSTVAGEVIAATIANPLEVAATPNTVKIGLQSQAAGDITIKEVAKEVLKYSVNAIANRALVLVAPPGVTFDVKPNVNVTEGDLKLNSDNVSVIANGTQLEIPILQSSLVPATISITNVKLNIDRTVPEGPLAFEVRGPAVNHFGCYPAGLNYATDAVGKIVVANVITPAPGDTKAESKVSFTIDSNMYTVGDAQKMMDVAPYIKSGRTYLPIRYVADALGVINDNIMWNDATQTVTIMKGERVIQLKIGSTIMKVQGTDITMDVAPEVKDGRTMLPVRFVGQALGATIGYDEATQTVTIE